MELFIEDLDCVSIAGVEFGITWARLTCEFDPDGDLEEIRYDKVRLGPGENCPVKRALFEALKTSILRECREEIRDRMHDFRAGLREAANWDRHEFARS